MPKQTPTSVNEKLKDLVKGDEEHMEAIKKAEQENLPIEEQIKIKQKELRELNEEKNAVDKDARKLAGRSRISQEDDKLDKLTQAGRAYESEIERKTEEIKKLQALQEASKQAPVTSKAKGTPNWATHAAKTLSVKGTIDVTNVVQKIKELNEARLVEKFEQTPDGYKITMSGNREIYWDTKKNSFATNNNSPESFKVIAEMVKAGGASSIDISQFKDQNPQAQFETQYRAYKAAKDAGLEVTEISQEEEKKFQDKYNIDQGKAPSMKG